MHFILLIRRKADIIVIGKYGNGKGVWCIVIVCNNSQNAVTLFVKKIEQKS